MFDYLLANTPFPIEVVSYLALGVLLSGAVGLPLWFERQRASHPSFPYIVSPYVILWVCSIGVIAILSWRLLLTAVAIGVTCWFVVKQGSNPNRS